MKVYLRMMAAITATLAALSIALADDYPNKPIRLIVPFAAGGTVDTLARIIGQKLRESWGQPVVVENRAGAGGNLGSDLVAKSPADGYTLLIVAAGHAINVSLYNKMPFDPVKDFAPITLVTSMPNVLVVHPSVPTESVQDLIALAKAKPGQLSYASAGNGTTLHLSGELFKRMTGVDMVHVPYKGSAPALADLLGGQVSLMFSDMPPVLAHIRAGKLRALAVTGTRRSHALPELPTIAEAGVPGFDVNAWFGMLAPAGTPKPIIAKLNDGIVKALHAPDVKQRLSEMGAELIGNTPEEFGGYINSEIGRWRKVVKDSGAHVD